MQKFIDSRTNKEKYRISVVARKDVPNFGPPINTDSVYENDENFKEWLLSKLVNAETACYKAEKFKKLNERTRAALLDALYNELHEKNMRVMQSIFPSSQSSMSDDASTVNSESTLSSHVTLSSRIMEHQANSNLLQSSAGNQNGSTTNLSRHMREKPNFFIYIL